MRIYLDSHNSYCLAAIDASGKYYKSKIKAAWLECMRNRLCFDTKTGIVYENNVWVECYSDPHDYAPTEDYALIFADYLCRHVKSRAARLYNREHA